MTEKKAAYFVHESSYVDEGCEIGEGTKVWHFSHIMKGCKIGKRCNIGQNVVISPKWSWGMGARFRTTCLFIPESCVKRACFRALLRIHKCHQSQGLSGAEERIPSDGPQTGSQRGGQCHHRLWKLHWAVCLCRRRSRGY